MKVSDLKQYALILFLIVISFSMGVLWSRNQYLEKELNGSNKKDTTNLESTNVRDLVLGLSDQIGVNSKDMESCLGDSEMANEVVSEESVGKELGVSGTPGNFLVSTELKKYVFIPGAFPYDVLKSISDSMLSKDVSQINKVLEDIKTKYGVEDVSLLDANDKLLVSSGDYVRGNADAKVLLVEYSDYECPFCIRFHSTAKQLVDSSNGNVAWIYRQFPLDDLHPDARTKSIAARCAGKLGGTDAFWKISDAFLTE